MRVFVDMDQELATQAARERVEAWWDHPDYPMSKRWPSKDAAVADLAAEYVGGVTVIETPARPPQRFSRFGGPSAGGGRFA